MPYLPINEGQNRKKGGSKVVFDSKKGGPLDEGGGNSFAGQKFSRYLRPITTLPKVEIRNHES